MYYQILTRDFKTGPRTQKFDGDNFIFLWEGLVFIKGLAPGEETIEKFAEDLKKESLLSIVENLSGVFSCIVHDTKNDIVYSFCGNSGLTNLFHSPKFVSTSFLKLVELSNLKKTDIKPWKYTHLVAAQSFMRWETYFDDVNRMRYDEVVVDDGSKVKVEKKKLLDLFSLKTFDKTILEQYGKIAESFKKIKGRISCDLTGGLDTRMNCVALQHHGLEFETSISGMPGALDVVYSQQVADILGTDHYPWFHTVTNNLEKEIEECFEIFEPLLDVVIFHRYLQFQKDKLSRNCVLTITGHAGEIFKAEFIWNLDNDNPIKAIDQMLRRGANIRYGIDLKNIPHEIYLGEYKKHSENYGGRLREFLVKNFGNDTSGRVGARIYAYFHEASRTANFGALINRFSPLLDRDLMPCGITLKTTTGTFKGRLKRLLTQSWDDRDVFESRVITSLNKKIAKVKITSSLGFNASTKRIDRLRKVYLIVKSKIKKPKLDFVPAVNPEFYPTVRSLSKTQEMLEILKTEGILDKNIKIEDIQNNYIGSFFTIGRFLEFLDNLG